MSLTLPTTSDLLKYMLKDQWDPGSEEAFATEAIQLAGDLMELASGVEETPAEANVARVVKAGLCAMAYALLVRRKDEDIEFNRFSSERIGSFSYSKMSQQAIAGSPTGVGLFDTAVDLLKAAYADVSWGTTSERVFKEPYGVEEQVRNSLVNADAYGR